MLTGSLYNSKYVGGDGIKRDTRFNSNFVTNLLAGKDFEVGKEKQNIIGLSTRGTVAGGKRYTPLDIKKSTKRGYAVQDDAREYEEKGPVYHRVDVAFYYTKNKKRTTMTWKLDVQNVANHKNVVDIEFDPERGIVEEKRGQILPVFSYRIEF